MSENITGSEIVGPLAIIPESFDYQLSEGWNLISLPLDPVSQSTFAEVFMIRNKVSMNGLT